MGISLAKGQKINLSKSGSGTLQRVFMGLGWDPVKPSGFFARLFSSEDIDLDASCLMFDQKKNWLKWFIMEDCVRLTVQLFIQETI